MTDPNISHSNALAAGWIQLTNPNTATLLDPGKETEGSRLPLYLKAPGKHSTQLSVAGEVKQEGCHEAAC